MSTNDAAFVDLSAAYDMVNHRIVVQKLFQITKDVRSTKLIQNMLASRRFFVDIAGKRSKWPRQKNGLPQRSVLAPLLFNIYTNDQPIHPTSEVSYMPTISAMHHRINALRKCHH